MAVTLGLLSQPYLGFPIKIHFSRPGGVKRWDYVSLSYNNTSLKWEWCCDTLSTPKSECNFNPSRGLGEYKVTYFEEGGYLLPGRTMGEFRFTLQNPVLSITAMPTATGQRAQVKVSVTLLVESPSLTLTLRADTIRIGSAPLDTSSVMCEGRLSCPRVAGTYSVVILGSDVELGTCQLEVFNRHPTHDFTVRLSCDESMITSDKVLVVRPNEAFFAIANGPLLHRHEDCIVVVEASHPGQVPKMNSLLLARMIELEQPLSVANEGLYHVILSVKHNSAYLMGAWALLLATKLKDTASMTTPSNNASAIELQQEQPQSPLLESVVFPSVSPGGGFMCVVCQDHHVQIKLDPCKHVCLCENCWLTIGESHHRCPMCRGAVESHEKLFFP